MRTRPLFFEYGICLKGLATTAESLCTLHPVRMKNSHVRADRTSGEERTPSFAYISLGILLQMMKTTASRHASTSASYPHLAIHIS